MLEVRLLGSFDIKHNKKAINISSRPSQSLFAYLILSSGTSHRREKLAGMLWPDSLEQTARDNLRHALWRIRKALPAKQKTEFLLTDDLSIAFNASVEYWLDASMLEKLDEEASADELIPVLSAYQGELLPGFYDEWVLLEREHINSVFEHNMARLMSVLQDENRWLDILDWAERWIKLGQKPESAYRALMSAHAAKGDMSKVAAVYERCVKSLKDFGVEPSEQTRALYEKLKMGKEKFETGTAVLVKEKRKESLKTNLPVPLTSFIGREKEVDEIIKMLGKNRLVTLMGAGGIGKTRLAIQSSHKLVGKFRDGVWWIELVGLNDAALVPQAVAKAVNVREIPNQSLVETLTENLQSKQILLVMDNCEHLISACGQLASQLLSECKKLKILSTSREAMDILGETIWHAPSLSLPDIWEGIEINSLSKFESVRLFMERAEVLQPQFRLTDKNVQAIVQICRRLSGMPLAIELAAARVKMMSVEEIASRLDDRFNLLTSGNRAALPRQQTLRAMIDWSHDLLTEPERILFRRLAVFAGGFILEAMEAVCGFGELKQNEALDLLGRLVDKSLVVVESDSVFNETRYHLLETIREYARKKLEEAGEKGVLSERHLEFFAEFVHRAEKKFYNAEETIWFKRLEKEIDNLRGAMDWSILAIQEHNQNSFVIQKNQFQIIGSLDMFWESRNPNEILQILKKMLALSVINEPTIEMGKALCTGGFMFISTHKFSDARFYLEESIKIAEKLDDQMTMARSLSFLGWTFDFLGEYDKAKTALEKSITIANLLGEEYRYIVARSLSLLGDIPYWQGDLHKARQIYEEAISFLREIHHRNMLTYPLRRMGYVCLREGDIESAVELFGESLEFNHEIGHFPGTGACLAGFAAANLAKQNWEKSAILCGYVDELLRRIGSPFFFIDTVEFERCVSALKESLGEKKLSVAWSRGRTLTLEQALEIALNS